MGTSSVVTFKLGQNKKRGLFSTTIISLLIGSGAILLSRALKYGEGRFVLSFIGVFALLVTLFCLVCFFHLIKDRFTAIYISEEGIYDISTGNRIGTILWKDIESIKVMDDISSLKRKYIVLKVRNPNEYIDREPSRSKKRSLVLRHQYYGSPICISNRALACEFEDLRLAIYQKYELYKNARIDK